MAGLIPQGFIDELLARTDIVELIDKRVPLKRTGANHKACCPFHQEKTPSFTVNADKQFYYCFGCNAGGNAVGFLMEYDNMSFPDAVDYLAHQAGIAVPREQNSATRAQFEQHQPLLNILQQAQQFFTQQLRQHPAKRSAINYLKGRGLSGTIARDFGIGFAPPSWDKLLTTLGTDNNQQQLLFDAGMLIARDNGGYYDRFRNRICFPIRDSRGRIIGFGGRIIDPNDQPKYLNSPETPVFNKSNELYGLYEARKANRQLPQLLVVEGYMDVISLAQMGINYSVATLGTAIGSLHLKRIFKHTNRVCFCFDGDDAGRRAAYKALTVSLPAMSDDKDVRFLFLPEGHDPDSLVRAEGKAAFETRLATAQTLSEYVFDCAASHKPLDTVDARAKFSAQGAKLIAQLPEGNYKQLMRKELASRSGLDAPIDTTADIIDAPSFDIPPPDSYDEFEAPPHHYNPEADRVAPRAVPAPTGLSAAHKACILLFHNPHLVHCADQRKLPDGPAADLRVLNDIIRCLQDNPTLSTGGLYGRWMKQGDENFVRSLLSAEKLCPAAGVEAELNDHLNAIEQRHLKHLQQQQISELKQLRLDEMSDEQKQKLRQLLSQNR